MASAAATARPISAKWVILGRFSHGVFCFAKPSFNSEWALIFLCLIGARLSCLADLASTSHGLVPTPILAGLSATRKFSNYLLASNGE